MSDTCPKSPLVSRRRCLQLGALGAAAAPLARFASAETAPAPTGARALRVAHLTDIHVQYARKADQGTVQCLHHAQSLSTPADLLITGGDTVWDVFEADEARTKELADLWRQLVKNECSLPMRACIGNHDIRPWGGTDPVGANGKAWATDFFGIERRYYSFDQGGWRFLILDSVQPDGDGYTGSIDPEQRAWLEGELARTPATQPIMIVSHIPILSVTPYLCDEQETVVETDHNIPGSWVLKDGASIHQLLREHPGVRLCLSGHMHLLDRCEMDGVTYICGGAVSASWWKGPRQKMDEGYGVVDLYDDGRFEYAYTSFGWDAAPEA